MILLLANMGHGIQSSIWLETLPAVQLHMDFFVMELVCLTTDSLSL